jgi:hypothetical protein
MSDETDVVFDVSCALLASTSLAHPAMTQPELPALAPPALAPPAHKNDDTIA